MLRYLAPDFGKPKSSSFDEKPYIFGSNKESENWRFKLSKGPKGKKIYN